MKLNEDFSGASFVDTDISSISAWIERSMHYAVRLEAVENVFRGEEVFALWVESVNRRIVCRESNQEYAMGPRLERYCAFTRKTEDPSQIKIEYCTFEEDIESRIKLSVTCTTVADRKANAPRVMSARYTAWLFAGGDYAGQYKCVVPQASRQGVESVFADFVRVYLGESSRYTNRGDEYDIGSYTFLAEGIAVDDKVEQMFLRIVLSGSIGPILRKRAVRGTEFSVDLWVSVSGQASDDITSGLSGILCLRP
jgi:hypothetical protein